MPVLVRGHIKFGDAAVAPDFFVSAWHDYCGGCVHVIFLLGLLASPPAGLGIFFFVNFFQDRRTHSVDDVFCCV